MTLLNIFQDLIPKAIGIEESYGLDFTAAYKGSGFVIITFSIIMAVIFYIVLGRWKPIWNTKKKWGITLAINTLICIVVTLLISHSEVDGIILTNVIGYLTKFSTFNFVLGDFIFIIFSILFRPLSKYCTAVPF